MTFILLAVLGGSAVPASAHSAAGPYFYSWNLSKDGHDIDWAFMSGLEFEFGDNFKDAVKRGDGEWNTLNGGRQAVKVGNYSGTWGLSNCGADREKNGVWTTVFDGPDGTLAGTFTCYDNDGDIKSAQIAFDKLENWSVSSPTGPNEYDVEAVATHEFGHFLGFFSHWQTWDNDLCDEPNLSLRETMCSGSPSGNSWKRTLETHDKHTFNNAY